MTMMPPVSGRRGMMSITGGIDSSLGSTGCLTFGTTGES